MSDPHVDLLLPSQDGPKATLRHQKITTCNQFMRQTDQFTKNAINKNFTTFEKQFITFISITQKTAYTIDDQKGELMIPKSDMTHLMLRRVETFVPVVLWVHVNIILNFVCGVL